MIFIQDNRQNVKNDNQTKDLVNDLIRFPQVLLIGPNGEQLGVMSSREAQMKANEYELDLLCVAPQAKPPVCKIINYGKFRFDQKKRAKEAKKNQHQIETKEIQLTPQIGIHDMETKAKATIKFLGDGNKVRVGVRFRGRQMTHVEVGEETMDKFVAMVGDVASVEKKPEMEGKWLWLVLAPKRK